MKLKIVSDGTVVGTNVVNAETGERVENVQALSWRADIGGSVFSEGVVRIINMEAELNDVFKPES